MFYSLRSRLTLTFVVLLVVPFMILVAVVTQISNSVIGRSIEGSTSQTMDQYASLVTTLTTQAEDVANQVLSNEITQQWISARMDAQLSTERSLSLDAELRKYLSSIALNHSSISSITIFNKNGTAVGIRDQSFRDPSFLQTVWYRDFMGQGTRWVTAHLDPYQPAYLTEESVNSLLFNLVQLSSFRKLGVLKVNVLTSSIQDPLDKIAFGEQGGVYLVDREGEPVLRQQIPADMSFFKRALPQIAADKRSGGKLTLDGKGGKHIVLYRKIKNADWLLVGEVPKYELFQKMSWVRHTMLWVGALLLIATTGAAFWLSSGIARPLSRLAGAMRSAERSGFKSTTVHGPPAALPVPANEVGYVTQVFSSMMGRLGELIETEFKANLRRQDAEYKALLMQINPHFLYNTLEAIGSLSAQERSDEVIDVTEWLGQMLRYSLRADSDLVALKEELRYIRHYVSIMSVRFGDRLRVSIEEEEGLGDQQIVKFILQPLVENAIKFGAESGGEAVVSIRAGRRGRRLEIEVADNGPGISPEMAEELARGIARSDLADVLSAGGSSIGLRNVLARCGLYYGKAFDAEIGRSPGGGASIKLLIPAKEE
ncbi:sensor histidine kinase [Cohnella sp. GCM10012308]|uniref:sensor histidine kinase n=1 Tax=Cohnella sp. GCM10012308 TaxID=3317329 RepID=UPI00360BB765